MLQELILHDDPLRIDFANFVQSKISEDDTCIQKILCTDEAHFLHYQIALVDTLDAVGVEPSGFIGQGMGELLCGYMDGSLTAEQVILAAYWIAKTLEETKLEDGAMIDTRERDARAAVLFQTRLNPRRIRVKAADNRLKNSFLAQMCKCDYDVLIDPLSMHKSCRHLELFDVTQTIL
ncbi:hypothetical protein TNCV_4088591 [Trichonephila clavipes]|nr:hypothetical protein TNCV_4088591 [Trichonephila clavipes]